MLVLPNVWDAASAEIVVGAGFVDNAAQLSAWARAGELRQVETEVHGLRQAPAAFLGLLRGEHIGRVVVTLP